MASQSARNIPELSQSSSAPPLSCRYHIVRTGGTHAEFGLENLGDLVNLVDFTILIGELLLVVRLVILCFGSYSSSVLDSSLLTCVHISHDNGW